MREWANVRPHRHWNTGRELLLEFLDVEIDLAAFARGELGRGFVIGRVFGDGKSWDGRNLLFAHQPHGFVAELVGVIDRSHTRLRGIQRSGFTDGVHGNLSPLARGLAHGRLKLGFRILIRRMELAVAHRVRPGLIDLDEVRAFLELAAHDGDEFVRVIRVVGIG